MRRLSWAMLFAAFVFTTGCTHREQAPVGGEATSSAASSTAGGEAMPTSAAAPAKTSQGGTFVTFSFTDISVTTSGTPVLRLGFDAKNGSQDPLLCDESEFSLQLADGTTLNVDSGAENTCNPDTIDPGSTGKVTMFFDLPSAGYTGPITVVMRSSDNSEIGRGTTQLR